MNHTDERQISNNTTETMIVETSETQTISMNYIDERRIAKVTDRDGSELLCEFSVYRTPDMRFADIKLREVTFPGAGDGITGHGVNFFNARDLATFHKIMRPDDDDLLDWNDIELRCILDCDNGETTSAIQPVSDRSDEG